VLQFVLIIVTWVFQFVYNLERGKRGLVAILEKRKLKIRTIEPIRCFKDVYILSMIILLIGVPLFPLMNVGSYHLTDVDVPNTGYRATLVDGEAVDEVGMDRTIDDMPFPSEIEFEGMLNSDHKIIREFSSVESIDRDASFQTDNKYLDHIADGLRLIRPHLSAMGEIEKNMGQDPKTRQDSGTNLEITNMAFSAINEAWAKLSDTPDSPGETHPGYQSTYGCFQVDRPTTITVSVHNSGAVSAYDVEVSVSIRSVMTGDPVVKEPQSAIIPHIGPGETKDVDIEVTPAYADTLVVTAWVDEENDPDSSNDAMSWSGFQTFLWSADLESDGEGSGGTWGGDIGNSNAWHTTSTPYNALNPDHSIPNAYYHGTDGFPDEYGDLQSPVDLYSPIMDLGDISDGQEELGELEEGYYYPAYLVSHCGLFTGRLEAWNAEHWSEVDRIYINNVSDDGGQSWESWIESPNQGAALTGNASDGWYIYGWDQYDDDDTVEQPYHLDTLGHPIYHGNITDWSNVRFMYDFVSDLDGNTDIGFYLDDYIVWGKQHWSVPYRIGISDTSSLGLCVKGEKIILSIEVSNYGEEQSNVPVTISVTDEDREEVFTKTWTIAYMPEPSEDEDVKETLDIVWKPTEEGDYMITISVGDLYEEWTPIDNIETFIAHVRERVDSILVVDDDNSVGNGGIFHVDTETTLLDAMDDMGEGYNVYSVGFDEVGPSASVLVDYEIIIWLTGLDNEYHSFGEEVEEPITLKDEDILALTDRIESGTDLKPAKLWLESPGLLYDHNGLNPASTFPNDFLSQYLKIDLYQANTSDVEGRGSPAYLVGVDGTLSDGARYEIEVPDRFTDMTGWVMPGDDANEVMYIDSDPSHSVMISHEGADYLMVYQCWNTPLLKEYEDERNHVSRVLDFFRRGPPDVDAWQTPFQILPDETIITSINISNPNGIADIFTLSESNVSEGWSVTLPPYVEVDAKSTLPVEVKVVSPPYDKETATLGYSSLIDLTITSSTTGQSADVSLPFVIGLYRSLTLQDDIPDLEMDVNTTEGIDIMVSDETNDPQDYSISMMLEGEGADMVEILDPPSHLVPNVPTTITLAASARPTEPAGVYPVTLSVVGSDQQSRNTTTFSLIIRDHYDVDIVIEPSNIIIDANFEESDPIERSFNITLRNMGNTPVEIDLDWSTSGIKPDWDVALEKDVELDLLDPVDSQRDGYQKKVVMVVTIPRETEPEDYHMEVLARINSENSKDIWEGVENLTISIIRPDIQITDEPTITDKMGGSIKATDDVEVGDVLTISYNISNIGNSGSPSSSVKLIITLIETQIPVEMETQLGVIHIGDTTKTDFEWIPEQSGIYRIEAFADPRDQMLETDEYNNMDSFNIHVQEIPVVDEKEDQFWGFWSCSAIIAIGFVLGLGILTIVKKKKIGPQEK